MQRQVVSQATLDNSTSARDNAQANLQQAQVNTRIAAVNYGYTNVTAPFDGIVSAHLVSVGQLVGASSPTQLATIVALDPLYVNFNVNEQDVLKIRAEARRRGIPRSPSSPSSNCHSRSGCRPRAAIAEGKLDYASADGQPVRPARWPVRGVLPNADRVLLARSIFVEVRGPGRSAAERLAGPDESRWAAIRPDADVLVVNGDMSSSSARCRSGRWKASCA